MNFTTSLIGIVVAVVIAVAVIPVMFDMVSQEGLEPTEEVGVTEVPTAPPAPAPEFTDTGGGAPADTPSPGSGVFTAIQIAAALIAVVLILYKFTGLLGWLPREGSTGKPGKKRKAKLSILGIRIK